MSSDGHDLNVLEGIKTAIFHGETERLEEFFSEYTYTAHEYRQFADIADMVDQPELGKELRQRADRMEE